MVQQKPPGAGAPRHHVRHAAWTCPFPADDYAPTKAGFTSSPRAAQRVAKIASWKVEETDDVRRRQRDAVVSGHGHGPTRPDNDAQYGLSGSGIHGHRTVPIAAPAHGSRAAPEARRDDRRLRGWRREEPGDLGETRVGSHPHRQQGLEAVVPIRHAEHLAGHENSDATRADLDWVRDSRWRFRDALPDDVDVGWGTYLSPVVVATLSPAGSWVSTALFGTRASTVDHVTCFYQLVSSQG